MDDWVLDARVDQIRAFVSVLGALKLSKRQLVQVSVAERGVTIVAQDLSKSLQAQVNFRAETFLSYRVNAAAAGTQGHHGTTSAGSAVGTFGLDLGSLIDVLNAFAPLDGECDLSMRWPDRDNALVLAAVTSRDGAEPGGDAAGVRVYVIGQLVGEHSLVEFERLTVGIDKRARECRA